MKILSVDDDQQNLYLIESVGRAHGYQVTSARNGCEALECMEKELPDLIISDILMPEMDGFQLCHEVKSHERTSAIPLIFYTATYTADQDRDLALSLGASRFILKPVEPDQLVAVIEEVIGEARAASPESKPRGGTGYLQQYNARLVRKLDHKIEQLEATRHELQDLVRKRDHEIEQRKRAEEDRSRMEAQFLQAQKLESLGRLAGGIAHDFNNLLTVINGYSEIFFRKLPQSDPMWNGIKEIRTAGERAARMTKQLLAFSRRQAVNPGPVDINKTVAETRGMLQRLVGDDVEVVINLSPVGKVIADEGQLHQVLLNLVVNARDAMPTGGRLTIATEGVRVAPAEIPQDLETRPGPCVKLTVADTGTGMDAATLEHIFEPFFTTKSEDRGTGLGLSTVFGIVRQSGGWIQVTSAPGCGSTFAIFLPEDVSGDKSARAAGPEYEHAEGHETVLVVEDNASVRSLMVQILDSCGYRVLDAGTGAEAISLAQGNHGAIDLLLTDVQMPRIDGMELARQLRSQCPELRVLFVSGLTPTGGNHDAPAGPGVGWVSKPFEPAELANGVRRLLDSPLW